MAIITANDWMAWSGTTVTGAELTSLTAICSQVDSAIKARLNRTLESASYTLVLDAPATNPLIMSRWAPIAVSGFTLYYNANAQGDSSEFTTDDELTMYSDYMLDLGPDNLTHSLSGLVVNLKGAWGVQGWRPNYSIAFQTVGIPGSIKVTFTGGYTTIPPAIVEAACLAVSKIRRMRQAGTGVQSESWNGDSYSLASNAYTYGIFGDPVIAGLLNMYDNKAAIFG